jgi:hypothetical protein
VGELEDVSLNWTDIGTLLLVWFAVKLATGASGGVGVAVGVAVGVGDGVAVGDTVGVGDGAGVKTGLKFASAGIETISDVAVMPLLSMTVKLAL